jgi:hypothetical protein
MAWPFNIGMQLQNIGMKKKRGLTGLFLPHIFDCEFLLQMENLFNFLCVLNQMPQ